MMGRVLLVASVSLLVTPGLGGAGVAAQSPPVATFKSSVDLVRVAAIVRDGRGRFVQDLTARDFEVFDEGRPRRIADFQRDAAGVSVAMLLDASGSMAAYWGQAHQVAADLLSLLGESDEAAIFTFDTRVHEIVPFTRDLHALPEILARVAPFGGTSLHDAIAESARSVDQQDGKRRAIVVATDGSDNASRLTSAAASGIASQVDVPVYFVAFARSSEIPSKEMSAPSVTRSKERGALSDIAARTGGQLFFPSAASQRLLAVRQIVDELRHQYLLAIETSDISGWHPLEVRVRQRDLTVRARSGYIAGQSRPIAE